MRQQTELLTTRQCFVEHHDKCQRPKDCQCWCHDVDAAKGEAASSGVSRDEAVKQFRMDELEAVMLSVDKWLDDAPTFRDTVNPATRAAAAREVALRAIEKLQTENDALKARLSEAVRQLIEKHCGFNCDAESGCSCRAHVFGRDVLTLLKGQP